MLNRTKLHQVISNPNTRWGRYFTYCDKLFLLLYCVAFSLETLPNLSIAQSRALILIEAIFIAIFTVQYIAQLYAAPKRLKYAFSLYGLIDLISIFPLYLLGVELQIVRALRLLRVVKIFGYTHTLRRIIVAASSIKNEFLLFGLLSLILIFFSSVGIYLFERHAQPEIFTSVFHSAWWSVVTLTTVGYGDHYPITVMGRVFAAFVMIIGIGFIAVPTGLFASALSETSGASRKKLILFHRMRFCIVGKSQQIDPQTGQIFTVKSIEKHIQSAGGHIDKTLSADTDYLLVCDAADRQTGQVIKLGRLQIISDIELIDALEKQTASA